VSDDTGDESRSRKSKPEQTGVKVRRSGRMSEKTECLREATVCWRSESDDSGDDMGYPELKSESGITNKTAGDVTVDKVFRRRHQESGQGV